MLFIVTVLNNHDFEFSLKNKIGTIKKLALRTLRDFFNRGMFDK